MVLHELVEETMTACQNLRPLSNSDDNFPILSNAHNLLKMHASLRFAHLLCEGLEIAHGRHGPLAPDVMELLAKQ